MMPGLDGFFVYLRERTGLVIPETRRPACAAIVARAMETARARSIEQFQRLLDDVELFDALVNALTIGETYFFRDSRQLDFVRRVAVPDLVRERGSSHVLSVWSAGCATGEEAYSLAALLLDGGLHAPPRVLGTDLSRQRLAVARRARYGKWSLRGVEPAVVDQHFRRVGSMVEVNARIRSAVRFQYLNLADEERESIEPRALDLVVCRNVLIYLDAPTIQRVARRLVSALADGGWLLLGASDPPLPDDLPCEVVISEAGLAYRRTSRHARARRPTSGPRELRSPASTESLPVAAAMRARAEVVLPNASTPRHASSRSLGAAAPARERERESSTDGAETYASSIRSLADSGRLSEAALACAVALEAHPLAADLFVLQSLLLLELGRPELASEAARRALYLNPDLVMAHLASGSAAHGAGDTRAAGRSFRNALQLLEGSEPESIVPASGGELAGRLATIAQYHLRALEARAG